MSRGKKGSPTKLIKTPKKRLSENREKSFCEVVSADRYSSQVNKEGKGIIICVQLCVRHACIQTAHSKTAPVFAVLQTNGNENGKSVSVVLTQIVS